MDSNADARAPYVLPRSDKPFPAGHAELDHTELAEGQPNAVIFHNALDIAEIVRQLLEEGWETDPEDLAHISPYLTEHIKGFGEYSTHELGIQPEAYETKLDVDFTQLREDSLPSEGLGQAA
ncbi:Tn3 family transposase [Streptomyces sp. SA15]|uniref:Tn3 family transposase n=1 Tax=Streptomyces sp. SA15 TaxID=934019 RepID=UPI0026AC2FC3